MAVHSQDEVAKVAYELYVKGGFLQGRDLADWLEAERIVSQGGCDFTSFSRTAGKKGRRRADTRTNRPETGKEFPKVREIRPAPGYILFDPFD
jgi:hypothetical protein